ncbi:MAG: hypothetical protein J6Y62_04565 [Clostridia bacterium]|nr:hypothetical protein [Clostridia bacterium]
MNQLHFISERATGGTVKAIVLKDGEKIAEAETEVTFDEKTGKTGFDILAEELHEKTGIKAESIRKALDWASCNSSDCTVFIGR